MPEFINNQNSNGVNFIIHPLALAQPTYHHHKCLAQPAVAAPWLSTYRAACTR